MSGFKEMLEALPVFGEAWLKIEYVDPETGLIIAKLTHESALVPARFHSSLMIQTSQGPMNLAFQIEAANLEEAVAGWTNAAKKAVVDFDAQMRENQRKILLPTPNLRPGLQHHG